MADNSISKLWIVLSKFGVAFIFASVFMFVLKHSYSRIEETEVGVLVEDGKIKSEVLKPGIVFHAPFVSKVRTIPVTPQQLSFNFAEAENGFITKDMRTMGAQIQITWKYQEARITEVVKQYTPKYTEGMIRDATLRAFREYSGDYTIEQLLQNKDKVSLEILNVLKQKMNQYPVEILQMTIVDWDLADSYKRYMRENNIKYP